MDYLVMTSCLWDGRGLCDVREKMGKLEVCEVGTDPRILPAENDGGGSFPLLRSGARSFELL